MLDMCAGWCQAKSRHRFAFRIRNENHVMLKKESITAILDNFANDVRNHVGSQENYCVENVLQMMVRKKFLRDGLTFWQNALKEIGTERDVVLASKKNACHPPNLRVLSLQNKPHLTNIDTIKQWCIQCLQSEPAKEGFPAGRQSSCFDIWLKSTQLCKWS